MNEKQIIELIKFTAFEMVMPQKLSDEDAESILKDYKQAINYSQCCKSDSEQLKCEHKYGQLKYGIYTCFDCGHKEEW